MKCTALIHAQTAEYDLRADSEKALEQAIKEVSIREQPDFVMKPLKMFNGQWRAIVIGRTRYYSEELNVFSNSEVRRFAEGESGGAQRNEP